MKNPGKIIKVLNRKYQLSFAFKITELNCIHYYFKRHLYKFPGIVIIEKTQLPRLLKTQSSYLKSEAGTLSLKYILYCVSQSYLLYCLHH